MYYPVKTLDFKVHEGGPILTNKKEELIDEEDESFWANAEVIPKSYSSKRYRIAIVSPEGVKVIGTPHHPNIEFIISQYSAENVKAMWPRKGFYLGNFDIDYRHETEKEYPFDQYKEDICISEIYHDMGKRSGDYDQADLIFIPPIGVKLDDEFANKLYNFLTASEDKIPNACAYQVYMTKKERIKNKVFTKLAGFIPDYPYKSFRSFGGTLIKRKDLKPISIWTSEMWFRNRYEALVQHYCEVLDQPIVVSPTNLYSPLIDF
ncbi:hypothetical protein EDI_346120 [Entamoeba dispar SAW760]|uniref:Uncharacterized protein n=1 Tax=Entamoeba dispar (strain ATCC PRA-260 / SAW760) TaxID=370354 RepID=B0E681_ENTDS|nr:uncharacterized protein EDI_346120 [Entamoeba dispar SAW760]EDR29966.1 hypothetical protein EDI_346120 [Entamoeba dispar SAW760]|eukprot:EDR29966.1 hypothetical protein EDI_346120 [Entamoeba dispar SAW760]